MAECACGCGRDAGVYRKRGREGQPRQFIHGHNRPRAGTGSPVIDRLMANIVVCQSGCWLWTGSVFKRTGYGALKLGGRLRLAHRVSYERFRGPIPNDLPLDHLCRERRCVNPLHLEAVPIAENVRRGAATKLTREDVAAIRASDRSNREVADQFGVSASHVSRLRSGDRAYWEG